ncbi:MAG: Smr/MutS family protein [Deltaproteobacteria bacterium]|nr:Smr/MutS family protein [Deltaproteobacteria bacterium]
MNQDEDIKPVVFPVGDVIDLHTFRPGEVKGLLDDYFSECIKKNIFTVRVIHGKGRGILKKRVESILDKNPKVLSHVPAPPGAGGWGATMVRLKKSD